MIRTETTPVEVVVRETKRTVYVCDGCGAEWVIGTYDGSSVNTLHPPRSWWRVTEADNPPWDDAERPRSVRHACSDDCLLSVAAAIKAGEGR